MAKAPSLALVAGLIAAAAITVPPALADGDPASDYLLSQPVFLPIDNPVSPNQAATFAKLVLGAQTSGLPIKVAVISSKYDLGSVPILFGSPQKYANFLGQELFYYYKHNVLIVMPNGYGIYDHGRSTAVDQKVLAKLHPAHSTNGNVLAAAGTRAVEALAKHYGVTISTKAASPGGSSTNQERLEIGAGALVLLVLAGAAALLRRRLRSR
ncbi:MAG TPA: hypothetical protein VG652_09050 [Gaiellaceae bacterium]|nr:hypothetical protein [Gaiellaceae bacterium]